jgi:hypothetical protein
MTSVREAHRAQAGARRRAPKREPYRSTYAGLSPKESAALCAQLLRAMGSELGEWLVDSIPPGSDEQGERSRR